MAGPVQVPQDSDWPVLPEGDIRLDLGDRFCEQVAAAGSRQEFETPSRSGSLSPPVQTSHSGPGFLDAERRAVRKLRGRADPSGAR
jgi:hypothetical protein